MTTTDWVTTRGGSEGGSGRSAPCRKARRPRVLLCHVMRRTDVFQIRIEPELRDRLARLRDERHVNVSAWARDVIAAALDREFPAALEAPTRQPLAGWKPCKLDERLGRRARRTRCRGARGGPAWNPDQHHRQSRRLLDGYDHRGRLPQPAAHRRPRLRPAVGVHTLLDTLLVAQDEGIKRDREHQELPEGDDEEPGRRRGDGWARGRPPSSSPSESDTKQPMCWMAPVGNDGLAIRLSRAPRDAAST